jgi:hypothetical protein
MTQILYANMNNKKKDCSLPPIKVQTKPVYLRKPLKSTVNEKLPQPRVKMSVKSPTFTGVSSSEFPASRLCCTSLAVEFPFSLKILLYIQALAHHSAASPASSLLLVDEDS